MLTLSFVTIHPSLIDAYRSFGVFARAERQGQVDIVGVNLRDFAVDRHGTVDGKPYGGGDGMVLRPDCLAKAVNTFPQSAYVVAPSPRGTPWSQKHAHRLASLGRDLVFVCGRFGGIDERFYEHHVDEEFSLGDFVVSGGELAALAMADSILRLFPGVLGNAESARFDSFSEGTGGLLEHPLYTKPEVFAGASVPKILLSGDHKKIETWKEEQTKEVTRKRRPDLFTKT